MQARRNRVVQDLRASCPDATKVRNPRTGRCVARSGPLGKALTTLVNTSNAGYKTCPGTKEWDAASGRCVSDGRAGALRVLRARLRNAATNDAASNKNAAAIGRLITKQALTSAAAQNRARQSRRDLREAESYLTTMHGRAGNAAANAYAAKTALLKMTTERDALRRELATAKATIAQLQKALLNASDSRNTSQSPSAANVNAAFSTAGPSYAPPTTRTRAPRPIRNLTFSSAASRGLLNNSRSRSRATNSNIYSGGAFQL